MPKYRKKPAVIDAWRNDGRSNTISWLTEALDAGTVWFSGGEEPYFTIKTLEGEMRANWGDYIIRDGAGELYTCKPDIFDRTYETV